MAKGDDKLSRKAEEQAIKVKGTPKQLKQNMMTYDNEHIGIFSQISTEFCNWLKELPHGNDDTVNNTQPEKIRALFDTSAQKTEQVV